MPLRHIENTDRTIPMHIQEIADTGTLTSIGFTTQKQANSYRQRLSHYRRLCESQAPILYEEWKFIMFSVIFDPADKCWRVAGEKALTFQGGTLPPGAFPTPEAASATPSHFNPTQQLLPASSAEQSEALKRAQALADLKAKEDLYTRLGFGVKRPQDARPIDDSTPLPEQ